MLTDWQMEFICSERCSTVWNRYQPPSAAATWRGNSDLLSGSYRTAPLFIKRTSWRLTRCRALLRRPLFAAVEQAASAFCGYSSSVIDYNCSDLASELSSWRGAPSVAILCYYILFDLWAVIARGSWWLSETTIYDIPYPLLGVHSSCIIDWYYWWRAALYFWWLRLSEDG